MESTLVVKLDGAQAETAAKKLQRELDGVGRSGERASKGTKGAGDEADRASKGMSKLKGAASAVAKGLMAVSAAGFALYKATQFITNMTDSMAGLKGQLALVTSGQNAQNSVLERGLKLANETGQSLNSTINLYGRMARASEELGLSQDDLFTVTKAINQSFVVSGASAQEASSAILQLSQGIASGTLRGEELNSVMENSPRLAKALADGMGIARGELRKLGSEGKITGEAVTSALLKMSGELDAEFQRMPMTVQRAMNELKNNFTVAFTEVNVDPLTDSIGELSSMLRDPEFVGAVASTADGILRVSAAAITASANVVQWSKDLGEWFGELFAGPGGGAAGQEAIEKNLAGWEREMRKIVGLGANTKENSDRLKVLSANIKMAREHLAGYQKEADKAAKSAKNFTENLQPLIDRHEEANASINRGHEELDAYTVNWRTMTDAVERGQAKHERTTKLFQEGHDALDEYTQGNKDYVAQLEFEVAMLEETEREQAILTGLRQLNQYATEEETAAVRAAIGAKFDDTKATKEQAAALKEATNAVDPWADAMVHAAERIDTAWVDMWKSGLEGFDDFSETLKNAFIQMLAEMAHLAITRPIMVQLGQTLGGAGGWLGAAIGAGTGAGGGTGGAGDWGLLGAGYQAYQSAGGLSGIYGSASSTIGGWFGGGGGATGSLYASSAGNGFAAQSGFGAAGADIGGGFGSITSGGTTGASGGFSASGAASSLGWAALAVGIFNTISDLNDGMYSVADVITGENINMKYADKFGDFGEFLFPSSTSFADMLGLPEPIMNQLFGGLGGTYRAAKEGNEIDFGTGEVTSFNREHTKELRDAADALTEIVMSFSEGIGGSSFSAKLTAHGEDGLKWNGKVFETADELLVAAFKDLTKHATNLEEGLQNLILGFEGTAEQTQLWSVAVSSLVGSSGINTATQATLDYADAQSTLGMTMRDVYNEQATAINTLMDNFDGSAAAAAELATELGTSKTAAYDMVIALQALSDTVSADIAGKINGLEESRLSPGELRNKWEEDRKDAFNALKKTTDGDEIARYSADIVRLTGLITGSMSDEEKFGELSPGHQRRAANESLSLGGYMKPVDGLTSEIDWLTRTDVIVDRQTKRAIGDLEDIQEKQNEKIGIMLEDHVDAQAAVVEANGRHVRDFGRYIRQLQKEGIPVNVVVEGRSPELVA